METASIDNTLISKLEPAVEGNGGESTRFAEHVVVGDQHLFVGARGMAGTGVVNVYQNDGVTWQLSQTLQPEDLYSHDEFGASISLSGDFLMVGTGQNNRNFFDSAGVYVYRYDGNEWVEFQKIVNPNDELEGIFGYPVVANDSMVLVGFRGTSFGVASKVFVYQFDGDSWSLSQTLEDEHGEPSSAFSYSMALNNERAVIGAPVNGSQADSKAVIYNILDNNLVFDEVIASPTAEANTPFPTTITLAADEIFLGAWSDNVAGSFSGSVYVYTKTNEQWNQTQRLLPTGPGARSGDYFGRSLSYLNGELVVGASGDGDGVVYLFQKQNENWVERRRITQQDLGQVADGVSDFGRSVGVLNDNLVVGAVGGFDNPGSVHTFSRPENGDWSVTFTAYAPVGAANHNFGNAVSMHGNHLIIGAMRDKEIYEEGGSASIFQWLENSWQLMQILTPKDLQTNSRVGSAVAIHEDTAVVVAHDGYSPSADTSVFYVYKLEKDTWIEQQKVVIPQSQDSEYYYASVSLFDDVIAIGAIGFENQPGNIGAVFVFKEVAGSWVQQQQLIPETTSNYYRFGKSVSVQGDRLAVGSQTDVSGQGAVYMFEYNMDSSSWVQTDKLLASDGASADEFGYSVNLSGDDLIIGAPGDNLFYEIYRKGSAYFFHNNQGLWTESLKVEYDVAVPMAYTFGSSVSLDNDTAVIGTGYFDRNSSLPYYDMGEVFVYKKTNQLWQRAMILDNPNPQELGGFGLAVDISNDKVVVGSRFDDARGTDSGAAYVFDIPPDAIFYDGFD
ncbi:hypothetical protein OS175_05260 [Marinicella sp. S1101]|uniref:hypothetical protein n=1 Tax=Marinicella marina TaxID=2996016 RepID=UPI002260A670|nr:hypothetical protein [Marinicella marina]MCX7553277.1 hypothetical protein [Marinicella marina]MDJ1139009.1 hypothetical protein [Marinicella marina]